MQENEIFTSLSEAAAYAHVTRQAIYVAIKKKHLKADKKPSRKGMQWHITRANLDAYRADKYNRDKRTIDGEKIIDLEQDRWSVLQAAKTLSVMLRRPYPSAHIYYLLRSGQIRGYKRGGMWILHKNELLDLYHKEGGFLIQEKTI